MHRRAELAVLGVVFFVVLFRQFVPFPLCPYRGFGGVCCPTCGTTTSINLILHGNLSGAWVANPIGFVAVTIFVRRLLTLVFFDSVMVVRLNHEWVSHALLAFFLIFTALRTGGLY